MAGEVEVAVILNYELSRRVACRILEASSLDEAWKLVAEACESLGCDRVALVAHSSDVARLLAYAWRELGLLRFIDPSYCGDVEGTLDGLCGGSLLPCLVEIGLGWLEA